MRCHLLEDPQLRLLRCMCLHNRMRIQEAEVDECHTRTVRPHPFGCATCDSASSLHNATMAALSAKQNGFMASTSFASTKKQATVQRGALQVR